MPLTQELVGHGDDHLYAARANDHVVAMINRHVAVGDGCGRL
jgi:hypothetical protein